MQGSGAQKLPAHHWGSLSSTEEVHEVKTIFVIALRCHVLFFHCVDICPHGA